MAEKTTERKLNSFDCSNCGLLGHNYKQCNEPVTSWGIVLVKKTVSPVDLSVEHCGQNRSCKIDISKTCEGVVLQSAKDIDTAASQMQNVKFLIVRRKHSLGFTEFVRGRYVEDNIEGIIRLFKQMTPDEITQIGCGDFGKLWDELWGSDDRKASAFFKREFAEAKAKFDNLRLKLKPADKNLHIELDLDFYVKKIKPDYVFPEWGFPKGRKIRGESDLDCAVREFSEETGINSTSIRINEFVKPLIENFHGTNGISYRHVYYLAEYHGPIEEIQVHDNNEIGDIGFFSYDDIMKMFREYHVAKKEVLTNVFMYFLNIELHGSEIVEPEKDQTFSDWMINESDF